MATVAMPLADGFEDSEFTLPWDRLRQAGHRVVVYGPEADVTVEGKRGRSSTTTERAARDLELDAIDALVIPGGHSPDRLRTDPEVVDTVRRAMAADKPVAAICHGPQLLIEAEVVEGRTLTSWPSVRKDLENAGAHWVDRELVEDGNLISSRKPDDLEAFCRAVLDRL